MKLGLLFGFILALTGCSSSDGSDGTPNGTDGGSSSGGASGSGSGSVSGGGSGSGSGSSSGGGSGSGSGSGSSSGGDGGGGGTFDTAAWVGSWTCESATYENDASAAGEQPSTAVVTSAGTNQLLIVASSNGQPNCSLNATLASDTSATFPSGQTCTLNLAGSVTLTLGGSSAATLIAGVLATSEYVTVSASSSPLLANGQLATILGSCHQ
jgi:hypothetical protein